MNYTTYTAQQMANVAVAVGELQAKLIIKDSIIEQREREIESLKAHIAKLHELQGENDG